MAEAATCALHQHSRTLCTSRRVLRRLLACRVQLLAANMYTEYRIIHPLVDDDLSPLLHTAAMPCKLLGVDGKNLYIISHKRVLSHLRRLESTLSKYAGAASAYYRPRLRALVDAVEEACDVSTPARYRLRHAASLQPSKSRKYDVTQLVASIKELANPGQVIKEIRYSLDHEQSCESSRKHVEAVRNWYEAWMRRS